MKSSSYITHEEVRARAHQIWERAGRPQGREEEHWLKAEQELRAEREKLEPETPAATSTSARKTPPAKR